MKNSIKTTLSVLLLGLASTAALANPTTPVAASDVQSVQLTAQESKAVVSTRGAELTGVIEATISSNTSAVVSTTTTAATPVAHEVAVANTAIMSSKGDLATGRYEAELNHSAKEKAMETKATEQAQPQAGQDSESFILKSLKN